MPATSVIQKQEAVVSPPSSWCQETQELYDPVRPLGVGGFGSVWLAKQKSSSSSSSSVVIIDQEGGVEQGEDASRGDTTATTTTSSSNTSGRRRLQEQDGLEGEEQQQQEEQVAARTANQDEERRLVAIKVVGHPHNQKISSKLQISEEGYFHREVSVLQEISHPRIVRCLKVIEDTDPTSSCAPYCMVLEYCRGPTVEQLVKHGGALGLHLAQEVTSQLIDAISFLHGRAVIHRDIKPDNIIVNGAKRTDEACWSDDTEGSYAAMFHRWNIKLIDFGFARPLRPEDISDEKKVIEKKKEPRDEFFGRSTVNNQLDDRSIHKSKNVDLLNLSQSSSYGKENNVGAGGIDAALDISNSSLSRRKVRNLSAVGNRNFAAPEIKKGIRMFKNKSNNKVNKKQADPLTDYVSDYGMIVDAFSTGATIRYMCTGVPPNVSVEEFLLEKNSAVNVLGRKIKKAVNKKYAAKRQKRYRSNKDLPTQAVRLILGLTHWNEKKRTTVRSARDYEWVRSSYSMTDATAENNEKLNDPYAVRGGKLDFLKCASPEII